MSNKTAVTRMQVACLYQSPTVVSVRATDTMMREVRQQEMEMFMTLSHCGTPVPCLSWWERHLSPSQGREGSRNSLYSSWLTSRQVLHSPE